jgi:hypothetical protein
MLISQISWVIAGYQQQVLMTQISWVIVVQRNGRF